MKKRSFLLIPLTLLAISSYSQTINIPPNPVYDPSGWNRTNGYDGYGGYSRPRRQNYSNYPVAATVYTSPYTEYSKERERQAKQIGREGITIDLSPSPFRQSNEVNVTVHTSGMDQSKPRFERNDSKIEMQYYTGKVEYYHVQENVTRHSTGTSKSYSYSKYP